VERAGRGCGILVRHISLPRMTSHAHCTNESNTCFWQGVLAPVRALQLGVVCVRVCGVGGAGGLELADWPRACGTVFAQVRALLHSALRPDCARIPFVVQAHVRMKPRVTPLATLTQATQRGAAALTMSMVGWLVGAEGEAREALNSFVSHSCRPS
jgi:hypothetical protein